MYKIDGVEVIFPDGERISNGGLPPRPRDGQEDLDIARKRGRMKEFLAWRRAGGIPEDVTVRRPVPVRDELQEQIDFIRWVMS